jgi:hypothetical protein
MSTTPTKTLAQRLLTEPFSKQHVGLIRLAVPYHPRDLHEQVDMALAHTAARFGAKHYAGRAGRCEATRRRDGRHAAIGSSTGLYLFVTTGDHAWPDCAHLHIGRHPSRTTYLQVTAEYLTPPEDYADGVYHTAARLGNRLLEAISRRLYLPTTTIVELEQNAILLPV